METLGIILIVGIILSPIMVWSVRKLSKRIERRPRQITQPVIPCPYPGEIWIDERRPRQITIQRRVRFNEHKQYFGDGRPSIDPIPSEEFADDTRQIRADDAEVNPCRQPLGPYLLKAAEPGVIWYVLVLPKIILVALNEDHEFSDQLCLELLNRCRNYTRTFWPA